MRKQKQVLPLFARQAEQDASSPTGENNDFVEEEGGEGQYADDELFQDDVEEEDMTYYSSARSSYGRWTTKAGHQRYDCCGSSDGHQ